MGTMMMRWVLPGPKLEDLGERGVVVGKTVNDLWKLDSSLMKCILSFAVLERHPSYTH